MGHTFFKRALVGPSGRVLSFSMVPVELCLEGLKAPWDHGSHPFKRVRVGLPGCVLSSSVIPVELCLEAPTCLKQRRMAPRKYVVFARHSLTVLLDDERTHDVSVPIDRC